MRLKLIVAALLIGACSSGATDPTPPAVNGPVGDWQLVEGKVNGTSVPVGDGFRITLLLDGSTVGGVAACNSYGGEFVADDEFIEISALSQTEMACAEPAMTAESLFLSGLMAVDSYEMTGSELSLSGPEVDLTFAPIPPITTAPLYDQRWVLEGLIEGDVVSSVQGEGFLLLAENGTLTGSTGCRSLNGDFIISADELIATNLEADGNCPAGMAQQDSHVISVIEGGFTPAVEEDRLTLSTPEGIGLMLRADR
ncbi:MAG: META domain-containing protein [Acidimicrobiia bacterium]|nr:META domain-containing protein [Acidimicrobiia bacterium]